MVNLVLDGVTNAEQDRINSRFKAPGSFMMLAINIWIFAFHAVYLSAGWMWYGQESELAQALRFFATFPQVPRLSSVADVAEGWFDIVVQDGQTLFGII